LCPRGQERPGGGKDDSKKGYKMTRRVERDGGLSGKRTISQSTPQLDGLAMVGKTIEGEAVTEGKWSWGPKGKGPDVIMGRSQAGGRTRKDHKALGEASAGIRL